MAEASSPPPEDMPTAGERVFYIRDGKGQPVACLAYRTEATEAGSVGAYVSYAASFLHPNDSFDRALARRIALGRLRAGNRHIAWLVGEGRSLSVALADLASRRDTPSRVRRVLADAIRRRAAQAVGS